MKKFLPYILILVMFALFFVPSSPAQAAGTCSNVGFVTPETCQTYGFTWTETTATNACVGVTGIGNIICRIQRILNSIIPILIALGLIYFIWGVVKYVIGGDEESKKKGREHIVYGIIGLAVIVGLWGFVNIVVNTFGLGGQATPSLPSVPGTSVGSCILITKPNFQAVLNYATCIISSSVIPLIFALALAMFIWGVVQFVINSGEEAKKEKGRQFMIWGIIALTAMVSVWGLVNILGSTFGINTGFLPQIKSVAP